MTHTNRSKSVAVIVVLLTLLAFTVGGASAVVDDGNNGHGDNCSGEDPDNPGNGIGVNENAEQNPNCVVEFDEEELRE